MIFKVPRAGPRECVQRRQPSESLLSMVTTVATELHAILRHFCVGADAGAAAAQGAATEAVAEAPTARLIAAACLAAPAAAGVAYATAAAWLVQELVLQVAGPKTAAAANLRSSAASTRLASFASAFAFLAEASWITRNLSAAAGSNRESIMSALNQS